MDVCISLHDAHEVYFWLASLLLLNKKNYTPRLQDDPNQISVAHVILYHFDGDYLL